MHNKSRPLSPHLHIYKPQISSVLSISHRASGIVLYIGVLAMSWILIFNIYNNHQDDYIAYFLKIKLVKLIFYIWLTSLYYHFSNGIRHLFWDIGRGFELKTMNLTGMIVIFAAFIMTSLTFIIIEL